MASRRRRLGAHAAWSSTRRAARSTTCDRAAAGHRDARRRLPRLRQAGDDARSSTGGFARSITRRRASSRATSLLDRLNMHSIDGYDVRRQVLGIVAQHLKPGAWYKVARPVSATARSAGWRRRWTWSCSRASREADCLGRGGGFDCSAMDWFLERARRARRRARGARAAGAGPAPAGARRGARAPDGRDPEGGLRATAGWNRHDRRGRDRRSQGDS